jgi:hypothetical protein
LLLSSMHESFIKSSARLWSASRSNPWPVAAAILFKILSDPG